MRKSVSTRKTRRYNLSETKSVKVIEVLTPEQIASIESIENPRDRAIAQILLDTGMRVSELTNLDYTQVFTDIRHKAITDVLSIVGKGNKQRLIPLSNRSKQAILAIDNYNRTTLNCRITGATPLLISRQHNRMATNTVRSALQIAIDAKPHAFRHTCLTNLRNNNTRLEIVQAIAGHSSIQTTQKYYIAVTTDDLTAAIQAMEPVKPLRLVETA